MLFETPRLGRREEKVVTEIDHLRDQLRLRLYKPRRWFESLRRVSMARAIQGSNSIEGYHAPLDDAAAVDLGEAPLDADQETHLALEGYRNAMTYVVQAVADPAFEYSEQLLKSLHFMMTGYDLANRPGLWRAGAIYVRNEETGHILYEGPDVDDVPQLVGELVARLNSDGSDDHPLVKGEMAHLNLVMIYPFRDGNGRMARCLQTLVLAREGVLSPVFCSIEEYLGHNPQDYYGVLEEVGGDHWQPEQDAQRWVRFMLTAHLRQARTLLQRVTETERLWGDLEVLARRRHLPERAVPVLSDATLGFRIRKATYRAVVAAEEGPLTDATASRDLRQLVEAGLLEPSGHKRGRHYTATAGLLALRQAIVDGRGPPDEADPFDEG
jgi:Fic family protein